MATEKLNLPTITGNMTADVVRDLNALANKIDELFDVPNGFASLDENGLVNGVDLSNIASNTDFTSHVNNPLSHGDDLNFTATDIDGRGVYKTITYTRPNGTVFMTSTLSNETANGDYATCTWRFYHENGASITSTKIWTLTYDDKHNVTKVVGA